MNDTATELEHKLSTYRTHHSRIVEGEVPGYQDAIFAANDLAQTGEKAMNELRHLWNGNSDLVALSTRIKELEAGNQRLADQAARLQEENRRLREAIVDAALSRSSSPLRPDYGMSVMTNVIAGTTRRDDAPPGS